MVRDGSNRYFSFWAFFALWRPPPALTAKKSRYKKTPYNQMMYGSWDMVPDGRTDRRKKWHIEVGAPPKNGQTCFKKIAVFPLWSPWKHQKPFGFLMFSGHQNGNTKRLLRYFWTFFNITHERTTQYFLCEIIFLHGGIHQSFSKNSS